MVLQSHAAGRELSAALETRRAESSRCTSARAEATSVSGSTGSVPTISASSSFSAATARGRQTEPVHSFFARGYLGVLGRGQRWFVSGQHN